MRFVLQPWQLFFLVLAGWINRQQQDVIREGGALENRECWEYRGLSNRVTTA